MPLTLTDAGFWFPHDTEEVEACLTEEMRSDDNVGGGNFFSLGLLVFILFCPFSIDEIFCSGNGIINTNKYASCCPPFLAFKEVLLKFLVFYSSMQFAFTVVNLSDQIWKCVRFILLLLVEEVQGSVAAAWCNLFSLKIQAIQSLTVEFQNVEAFLHSELTALWW